MKVSTSSLPLPHLGLGMAALGRPGYINLDRKSTFGTESRTLEKMQAQANLVLDSLFERSAVTGILPWIDCARSYGLSEKFVGEYLKASNIKPKDVFVSSKWGYTYVADWKVKLHEGASHEIKDHSVENFLKQVEETNIHLGEYVKLYQIHSATFESGVMDNKKVHDALHQCRKERGWSIGLSVSSTKQNKVLRRAMEIEVEGEKLFDSVQCTYNVLEQRPGPTLLDAHNEGMDIIIKEGLGNGRVLCNPSIMRYTDSEQIKSLTSSCSPDELALACILAQPFKPRVLSGAVTPEQLQSNWKAIQLAESLRSNKSFLAEIMESCVVDSELYWKERSQLDWN